MARLLDIGCGNSKHPGAVGLDRVPGTQADIVADLEQGLPFRSNTFTLVICKHVLEHIDDLMGLMEEIWRVSRPGGEVQIEVPHFASSGAYDDPTHRRYFSARTFRYFTRGGPGILSLHARFGIKHSFIVTTGVARLLGFQYLANLLPRFYEYELCFTFRAKAIRVTLEVIKDGPS